MMEAKYAISSIAQHLRPSTLATIVAELEIRPNESTLDNAVRVDAQVLLIRTMLFGCGLEDTMRFINQAISHRFKD
jgi:hypothetical protein